MSEAKEGCALLEDVDESTFIRFSQYAYTGDYIAANPEILLEASTIALPPSESDFKIDINETVCVAVEELWEISPTIPPNVEVGQAADGPDLETGLTTADSWGFTASKSKKKMSKKRTDDACWESPSSTRKEKLWKVFQHRANAVSTPRFHPRKNLKSCEDYTDVFLCHARLYVFAEKYDIGPLRKISLNKLHQTLCVFTLYKVRVGDIVTLLQYSYANTAHRSPTDDPLRSLVILYAACVVEDLVPSSDFKALLEEPGELASDLVLNMINRLD